MQEFDLKAKINCTMWVAVVAENRKEAERLLDDTIDSITFKELKEKLSKCRDIEIKESNVVKHIFARKKEMER